MVTEALDRAREVLHHEPRQGPDAGRAAARHRGGGGGGHDRHPRAQGRRGRGRAAPGGPASHLPRTRWQRRQDASRPGPSTSRRHTLRRLGRRRTRRLAVQSPSAQPCGVRIGDIMLSAKEGGTRGERIGRATLARKTLFAKGLREGGSRCRRSRRPCPPGRSRRPSGGCCTTRSRRPGRDHRRGDRQVDHGFMAEQTHPPSTSRVDRPRCGG